MEYHSHEYYKRLARLNREVAENARRRGDERKAQAFEWLAKYQETL